jgi:hypothetical protein
MLQSRGGYLPRRGSAPVAPCELLALGSMLGSWLVAARGRGPWPCPCGVWLVRPLALSYSKKRLVGARGPFFAPFVICLHPIPYTYISQFFYFHLVIESRGFLLRLAVAIHLYLSRLVLYYSFSNLNMAKTQNLMNPFCCQKTLPDCPTSQYFIFHISYGPLSWQNFNSYSVQFTILLIAINVCKLQASSTSAVQRCVVTAPSSHTAHSTHSHDLRRVFPPMHHATHRHRRHRRALGGYPTRNSKWVRYELVPRFPNENRDRERA